MIAAGIYEAVAVEQATDNGPCFVQFGETKSGTEQVAVVFELLGGPDAGSRITWHGYFSDKATKRTLATLKLLGFTGDDLMALYTQRLNQQVSLTIEHEEYNGKTSAKIKWVNAPGGAIGKSLPRDRVAALAKRIKDAAAGGDDDADSTPF